jgi:transcriptional regulator with XRE-family HTH domain
MRNILHSQPAAGNVLEHVAHNLRRLRTQAGLSQEALAQQAGLSRRMINGVESGNTNISLSNLDHVAAALGVTFVDLVRPPRSPDERLRTLIWQSDTGASSAVLLGAAPASSQVELWQWTLAPGERYDAQPDGPGFSEMLWVLSGELTLQTDTTRTIAAGDFWVFSSAQVYSYVNLGAEPLHFVRNVIS